MSLPAGRRAVNGVEGAMRLSDPAGRFAPRYPRRWAERRARAGRARLPRDPRAGRSRPTTAGHARRRHLPGPQRGGRDAGADAGRQRLPTRPEALWAALELPGEERQPAQPLPHPAVGVCARRRQGRRNQKHRPGRSGSLPPGSGRLLSTRPGWLLSREISRCAGHRSPLHRKDFWRCGIPVGVPEER